MKKIILSMSLALFMSAPSFAQNNDALKNVKPIDFGPQERLTFVTAEKRYEFAVEVADTREEQARGLMFRDVLKPNHGMLFEFDQPKVASIWMKNTAIPLDILFVRPNGRIIKIVHSHRPYSLRSVTSEALVNAVIEIPGGRANELGIEPGDYALHEFFGNVKR